MRYGNIDLGSYNQGAARRVFNCGVLSMSCVWMRQRFMCRKEKDSKAKMGLLSDSGKMRYLYNGLAYSLLRSSTFFRILR